MSRYKRSRSSSSGREARTNRRKMKEVAAGDDAIDGFMKEVEKAQGTGGSLDGFTIEIAPLEDFSQVCKDAVIMEELAAKEEGREPKKLCELMHVF